MRNPLIDEMRDAICELAGPRHIVDTRELWLSRAARKSGISSRMAKSLFYCEVSDPRGSVITQVRDALRKERLKHESGSQRRDLLREIDELSQRINDLRSRIIG